MYRVPPARAWWPAVGAPLERGVRQQRVDDYTPADSEVGAPKDVYCDDGHDCDDAGQELIGLDDLQYLDATAVGWLVALELRLVQMTILLRDALLALALRSSLLLSECWLHHCCSVRCHIRRAASVFRDS
jgi:hypothetical protein